jgi:hypothetical protein
MKHKKKSQDKAFSVSMPISWAIDKAYIFNSVVVSEFESENEI